MNIDLIRNEYEKYSEKVSLEYYLQGAGIKQGLDLLQIQNNCNNLFSENNISVIKNYLNTLSDPNSINKTKSFLEAFYYEIINAENTNYLTDLSEAQIKSTINIGSETEVIYRSALIYLINEPSHSKRIELSAKIDSVSDRIINPILEEMFLNEERVIKSFGFKSKKDMFEDLSVINLQDLNHYMMNFVNDTESLYRNTLSFYTEKYLKQNTDNLYYYDLLRLFRLNEYDAIFENKKMLGICDNFTNKMGLDLRGNGRINLDLEVRIGKSPRAFCTAVKIPGEIYLSLFPNGGLDSYTGFLHEMGHALHFAHTDPGLLFEEKYLGDYSVTESYALLFDHLMFYEPWLKKFTGFESSNLKNYMHIRAFYELFQLRKLAFKLNYELFLSSTPGLEGKKQMYAGLKYRILHVKSSSSDYLSDIDTYFYSARYIRAWMLQSVLQNRLSSEFSSDWFINRKSGKYLKELWNSGQKYSADELSADIFRSQLNLDLVKENIFYYLNN